MRSPLFEQANREQETGQRWTVQSSKMLRVALGPEVLAAQGNLKPTLLCGIPDIVTEHGDSTILLDNMALGAGSLQRKIEQWLQQYSR